MLATNYTRNSGCVDISSPSSVYSVRPKFNIKLYHHKPTKINYSQIDNAAAIGRPKRFKIRRLNSIGHTMDLLKKQKIPDYTDTAYKEAVSKLKYLLAESYTPRTSRRIYQDKNIYPRSTSRNRGLLNDIDLQSVISDNTTLPDKNNQQSTSILTQVDDSSAPSRELKTLIMRQEEYIEQLEQESRYCKDELKNLLGKIRNVVAENELLHDKNKMALLKSFLNEHNNDNNNENIDNKKLIQKNSLTKIKSRDNLLFDCGSSKIIFESRISELEAQLTQCKIELKKALEDINTKNISDKNTSINRENNDTIEQVIREKCELTNKIDDLTKNLKLSREREAEANQKIKNAIENKQQIEYEKSQAEMEVRRLKDDLERQRHKIREVGQENCRKLAEERHEVERRYGQQVEQLSADVATHWDVASKSQLEIEKQRREIFDLKRELGQKQAIIDDLKKELLSKISNLQNDIYQVTTEKDSLEQELATAKLAADRSERHARQEQSRYQSEINSYKQRIERADADIVHCRRENLRLSEQIASLEKELSMSKMIRTTDTPSVIISTQSKTAENEMSGLIKNMEVKHEDPVEVVDDGATINSMNLHKKKKRTVKVDLKLEIKPKKKSVGFEMGTDGQPPNQHRISVD
ncbi:serologically defined colon cancer antigen 8 homolog isoform X2 [Aphidius gifuensis]|uniref:serologically defined colon cancer antigen 8 homolog isoform X2 n=1 Tax=Aphidius gifuensis TaxID=684658 RepID=UPI001CDB5EFE|nr:serologically defined colon cancer antigen 8 homolog isoform X2 [Aphidius gifuensis]